MFPLVRAERISLGAATSSRSHARSRRTGDGVFVVGVDIQPGTYHSDGPSGISLSMELLGPTVWYRRHV